LLPFDFFKLLIQKQVFLIKLALEWQAISHRIAEVVLSLRALFIDKVERMDYCTKNGHAISK
jgi:hypothetical protein